METKMEKVCSTVIPESGENSGTFGNSRNGGPHPNSWNPNYPNRTAPFGEFIGGERVF